MQFRTREYALAFGLALSCLAVPGRAQLPPPTPPPPATLWSFLGIPQAYRSFRDTGFNRRGNNPARERKPPMLAIADPKNLKVDNPAIKKAAEIKMEQDLAPQKIKAIKYLAQIGCGCYNRDGSITDALLKSLDDCTEEVRVATVQSIALAAAGELCSNCKMRSCCSEEISNKLYEIAYERDEDGCFLEPSERVRLAAAEALRVCCPGGDDGMIFESAPAPTIPGGELPGIVPEGGGERPGLAPPVPIPTPTAPITPIPGPPMPVLPPAAPPAPPAPAPAAGPSIVPRSSRRTAASPATPAETAQIETLTKSKSTAPQTQAKIGALQLDVVTTPHWSPAKPQRSVYFLPPARGPLPIFEPEVPSPSAVANAVRIEGTVGISPLVKQASLTRLPPVEPPAAEPSSAQRLPPVTTEAIPVSTRRLPPAKVDDQPPTGTSTESPKRTRPVPVSQRKLPGAEFGTGIVTAVKLKEGMALLEFSDHADIPPGSVLRAYHDYALTGKVAVCDLEVVRGEGGMAAVFARSGSDLTKLSVGDRAIVLR